MFEAVTSFFEVGVVWIVVGIFLLTICKIAFDVFKDREKRKMAEMDFRGALPKVIHKSM